MFLLEDLEATNVFGRRLAETLSPGDVVALWGDLGVGKTALARAVIRALSCETQDVPSPTFTLVQTYETRIGPLWHFDLYRLSFPEDIIELGWEEARADGVVLVEWPDRLGPWTPSDRLDVTLTHCDCQVGFDRQESRQASVVACGKRLTSRNGDAFSPRHPL
ncbi:tRNA threonylcarbamoyladenosine biosynthesis protein TsaE [Azospirillaceae bacterium]